MKKDEQKEIISFIPNELADPRTHTISLDPIKDILKEHEISKDDLLQTYRDENERLAEELEKTKKSVASHEIYRLFREKLSLYCFQINTKATILQCAERVKRGHCSGCKDRNILLDKLEALPRRLR